ncbi:TadE/TadG family type IV pilus assembly protein [Methylobacterium sp. M6A4_1b]
MPVVPPRPVIAIRRMKEGLALRFARAEEGVAILEFALIVPVLLLIYFGTVELTSVMRNVRKVDILSRTIGDTLSQRTIPTAAEVNDVFQVAPIVLAPFESGGVQMTVSAVGVVGDGETGPLQVCSSVAASGSPVRAAGTPAPVAEADSIQPKGTRMLLVEISATYKPVAGSAFFKDGAGFAITRKTLWPVRYGRRYASMSPEVVLGNGISCPPR